jgi:MFS transporter, ACS family, tartrate transporter
VGVLPSAAVLTSVELAGHTRRHIAARLLPFLFVLYVANYIDRTNLAYAALGMTRDLGFTDRIIGLGVGIFFVTYVAGQTPGALLVERWSARRTIGASMIAWGLLTMLTSAVRTPLQLYLVRLALGGAEAAFFPGVVVYLSHWFIREDRAKASSNFMGAIPLSFVIGSPVAGWILGHTWFGHAGWRWLFVMEGIPAILLGVVSFFLLTDWPHQATWLAPAQRDWIRERLREEAPISTAKASIWRALTSRTILLLATANFISYLTMYTFAFWIPTMLKSFSGLSDLRVGVLGAIPYLFTFIAMQVNGWHSDRNGERYWHSAIPIFLSVIGAVGLISQPRSLFVLILFFTLGANIYSYLPTFFAIPTETLSQSAAAAAVGMINAFGSVAGFAGPYAFGYLHAKTGCFTYGLAGMAVAALAGGMMILCARGTDIAMDDPLGVRGLQRIGHVDGKR